MTDHLNYQSKQRGSVSIIAIIFVLVVFAVLVSSAVYRIRENRSREASQTHLTEQWEAKGAAAAMDRIIKVKLPEQYERDLAFSRDCGIADSLEPFDSQDVEDKDTNPAVIITSEGSSCANVGASAFTSLLGNINNYLTNRKAYLQTESNAIGFPENRVRIFSIKEAVRRFSADSVPTYQVHYVVDARGGRTGRFRQEGDVFLGNSSLTCGTTAVIKADTPIIERGQNATLTIEYSMANNLKIYELNTNTLIHEANVTESPNLQTYTFTFAPTATNTYRVDATGSTAGCFSQSGGVVITVNEPNVCATSPPIITLFQSSATEVLPNEVFNLQWQITGAVSEVMLDGAPVATNESAYPVSITEDTTFTLQAIDADPNNDCSSQQTVTVRVRIPCNLPMPRINFTADRYEIQLGESATLTWSITDLDSSSVLTFIEPDGRERTPPSAASVIKTPTTVGSYTYKIIAKNICPDGTEIVSEKTVTIVVSHCPIPTINSFTVNPSTVYAGGSQNILFNWNVSGTIDAQSINQGIGAVSGFSHSILQPQSTSTYTYTVVGCGVTSSANVTVNVLSEPSSGFVKISDFQNYYWFPGYVFTAGFRNYTETLTPGNGYGFTFEIDRNTREFRIRFLFNNYNSETGQPVTLTEFGDRYEYFWKVADGSNVYPTDPYLFNSRIPAGGIINGNGLYEYETNLVRNSTNLVNGAEQNGLLVRCYSSISIPEQYIQFEQSSSSGGSTQIVGGLVNSSQLDNPTPVGLVNCIQPNPISQIVNPNSIPDITMSSQSSSQPYIHTAIDYKGFYSGSADPVLMFWIKRKPYSFCDNYGCYEVPGEAQYNYYNSNMRGIARYGTCSGGYGSGGNGGGVPALCGLGGVAMK